MPFDGIQWYLCVMICVTGSDHKSGRIDRAAVLWYPGLRGPGLAVVYPRTIASVEKCFQIWYGQNVTWRVFGVAGKNYNLAKCWCGKDKVSVALATPDLLHFPPMPAIAKYLPGLPTR